MAGALFYATGVIGLVDCQNDFPDVALFAERGLSFGDFAQRVGFSDQRPDFALFYSGDQIAEHPRFQDRAAEKTQIFEIKRAQVQRHVWPGDRSGDGVSPAGTQDFQ